MIEIRELSASEGREYLGELARILVDCVEGGASVSFLAPFTQADAESFFSNVLDQVANGSRILLAAFVDSKLVGTVQSILSTPPNQCHRADVAKLLVHRSARRLGVARRLMQAVEDSSRRVGKTLLVLDTVTGSNAEKLYQSVGWTRVGVIPNYAMFPDGTWCDTTVFWKCIVL